MEGVGDCTYWVLTLARGAGKLETLLASLTELRLASGLTGCLFLGSLLRCLLGVSAHLYHNNEEASSVNSVSSLPSANTLLSVSSKASV